MIIKERGRKVELTKNEYKKAHEYGTEEYKALQEIRVAYPGFKVVVKERKQNKNMSGFTVASMRNLIQNLDADQPDRINQFNSMVKEGVSYFHLREWFVSIHPEVEEFGRITKYSAELNAILTAARQTNAEKRETERQNQKQKKIQSLMITLAKN